MNILLPVGKISKIFGLDGGLLMNLYDTFPRNMNKEEPLFVKIDGLAVPLFAELFERRGQKGALIRFADIDNPARSTELLGEEIFVYQAERRVQTPKKRSEGEIFFEDLVGFTAFITEEGAKDRLQGVVTSFIESEMNPLLQLEVDGKEVYIPAVNEFIIEIDLKSQSMRFEIPEGLMELYL